MINDEVVRSQMDSAHGRQFVAELLFTRLLFLNENLHGEHEHDVVHNAAVSGVGNGIFLELFSKQPGNTLLMLEEAEMRGAAERERSSSGNN